MNKIAISLALVAVCIGFVAANQQKHEHISFTQKPCHQPRVYGCIEECVRHHGFGHSHGPSYGHGHGHGHGNNHGHRQGNNHGHRGHRHNTGKPVLIDYYGDDDFSFNDENDFPVHFHNQGKGNNNKFNFGGSESDFNFGDQVTPFHQHQHQHKPTNKHHKSHPSKGNFNHGPSSQKLRDTRFSANENNVAGVFGAHGEKDTLEGFSDRQNFEKEDVFIKNKEAGNRDVEGFRGTKEEGDVAGAFKGNSKSIAASDLESDKHF